MLVYLYKYALLCLYPISKTIFMLGDKLPTTWWGHLISEKKTWLNGRMLQDRNSGQTTLTCLHCNGTGVYEWDIILTEPLSSRWKTRKQPELTRLMAELFRYGGPSVKFHEFILNIRVLEELCTTESWIIAKIAPVFKKVVWVIVKAIVGSPY